MFILQDFAVTRSYAMIEIVAGYGDANSSNSPGLLVRWTPFAAILPSEAKKRSISYDVRDLRCGSCHPAVFFFASAGTVDPAGLPSWLEAAKGKKTNRLLNDQTFTSFTCCFRDLHVLRTEVSLAMHRLRDEL